MEEEVKERSFVNTRVYLDTAVPFGAKGRGCFLYKPIKQNRKQWA